MSFDQLTQVLGLVVTGVTTLWGYRSVAARLTNYVPVEIYRVKVSELHAEINGLKVEVAVLKDRAAK